MPAPHRITFVLINITSNENICSVIGYRKIAGVWKVDFYV